MDIIVFSDDWGRHPSSCQHLIRQLLPGNRVIWVNTIGMRSPQVSLYDIGRCLEIIKRWLTPREPGAQRELPKNLVVTSPVIIPYNSLPLVRRLNKFLVRRKIGSIMKEHGVRNPLVLTTFPCTCDYVGVFDERLHVYYCVDDFVNWPGVNLELIRAMEDQLIERSDLVLATAEALCDEKQRSGRRPLLLPHGVDFEHFSAPSGELPDSLQVIRRPVVGFFGAISAWLDFDLIRYLAKQRPEWSFVFIGPVDTDASALSGIPNIHLAGKIPYAELPRHAACFDVGIIPFQVNELTNSVNPLKLFEYLALGIPVVSTYMPEVLKYRDLVDVPRTPEEFLACLDRALADGSGEMRRQRKESAHRHSWHSVAERFSALVADAERAKLQACAGSAGVSP